MVTIILLGLALVLLGRWGAGNAHASAPRTLPEAERERRERVVLRGSAVCQVIGVVFIFAGLLRPLL